MCPSRLPPAPARCPPLSARPAGQGRGEPSGGRGRGEQPSIPPGAPVPGAAGAPRGALPQGLDGGSGERRGGPPPRELRIAGPPFRAGGLLLPAGTTRSRSLVAKRGRSRAGAALASPAPRPPEAALRRASCPDGAEIPPPPPGRGCRRRWAGGRGTQGLTAPRPGGAVKVHGLQMLFRPRCLPF